MSITTVFANGGSQAVRIPKKFRFSTTRVSIQEMNGGVLLLPVNEKPTLKEFFRLCDELDDDERDFLSDAPRRATVQKRDLFA